MYHNCTYKYNYPFKIKQSERKIKQKIEDKNNRNFKNRPGFAKKFNIQNRRNYDMNPAPFKKVLQSLHSNFRGTRFLIDF